MRIPGYRQRNSLRDDSPMTAMIDVVFLLLIFFVCASLGQIGEMLIGTELSGGSVESTQFAKQERPFGEVWIYLRNEDGKTIVQVNEGGSRFARTDGAFRLLGGDQNAPLLASILRDLAETESSIPVILDIDDRVNNGDVMRVYTAVKNARFKDIKFAAE